MIVPGAEQANPNMKYDPEWEKILEQDLTCGVCYNVYQYPINLGCRANHTICIACLGRIEPRCPQCRESIKPQELLDKAQTRINKSIQSGVKNSKVICAPAETEEIHDKNFKQKSIILTAIQHEEIQRYLVPRCRWSGYQKEFGQHQKQKCSNTFKVCQVCLLTHSVEDNSQCPFNIQYDVVKGNYFFSLNKEGVNNLDRIKIQKQTVEESKIQDLQIVQKGQIECPLKQTLCRTLENTEISCQNDHHDAPCPFELKRCSDCTMIYFFFDYKAHIKRGFCNKIFDLWRQLNKEQFSLQGILEIKGCNQFISSQLKTFSDETIHQENEKLTLKLSGQKMFQVGVLFRCGKFGSYQDKFLGGVKLRGIETNVTQQIVKGKFRERWNRLKNKLIAELPSQQSNLKLINEKTVNDGVFISLKTTSEMIPIVKQFTIDGILKSRCFDVDIRQL